MATPKAKRQSRIDKPQRGPGRIRGLTRARYLTLFRMVRNQETTWDELEQRGLALPARNESDYRREVRKALNSKLNSK